MNGQLLQRLRVGVFIVVLALTLPAFTRATAQTGAGGDEPAASPLTSAFSYQGKLEDGGAPADGVYDFAFRLYDGPNPATAVQIGPVVYRHDVTVSEGLFVTVLDFGTVFHGDACWLQIAVARDGEALVPLLPLQPLTAVPQALYGEDADADPTNEYIASVNLVGTMLQISDGGGTHSQNLGSLVNDQDWLYHSGSGMSGDIYHGGNVALGSLTDPDGHGLNVQNYTAGRAAVRGVEQTGANIYAEGLLGVYNSSNLYGLPLHVLNAGVLGLKPALGASGAAVYGWNSDANSTNYGGVFVANGGFGTNYALYALAQNGTQNVAGYFGGRVGVRELLPEGDLHILQSDMGIGDPGGAIFEAASNQQWKIKHTGTHFSFIENNVRRAYIEGGTGNYVTVSDEALKEEIAPTGGMLARVLQLEPVTFRYRGQASATPQLGFIAQDVAPLFPELVHTAEDGTLGLDYSEFSVVAIAALQEQQSQIDALRAENAALRADLETLQVAFREDGTLAAGLAQPADEMQFAAFGGGRELLNQALDQFQTGWSLLPFLALFSLLVWLVLRGRGPEVG